MDKLDFFRDSRYVSDCDDPICVDILYCLQTNEAWSAIL